MESVGCSDMKKRKQEIQSHNFLIRLVEYRGKEGERFNGRRKAEWNWQKEYPQVSVDRPLVRVE